MEDRRYSIGFDCVGTSADELLSGVLRWAAEAAASEAGGTVEGWVPGFTETQDGTYDTLSWGRVDATFAVPHGDTVLGMALRRELRSAMDAQAERHLYLYAALD